MTETIFALSSGAPPAAIGVIRISGPKAGNALEKLAGSLPAPREPSVRKLRDHDQSILDIALIVWFPGERTATGEDLAEIHCHGGKAVVAGILTELSRIDGLREANPGEFTRRAFANGRIDLAEAEGLADLLSAETELQRRGALSAAGGTVSRHIEKWRERALDLAAEVEAAIDFADEGDVNELTPDFYRRLGDLTEEIEAVIAQPSTDRLRDGVRVILAGPPNAGKSMLFNMLIEDGAAIVSSEAGTTRDVIERPIAIEGMPFVFVDTAGLRESDFGEVEGIGIERAREQIKRGDIVLWLGDTILAPDRAIGVQTKADLAPQNNQADHLVSSVTGQGIEELKAAIVERGRAAFPSVDRMALSRRQRALAETASEALARGKSHRDYLVLSEDLREARRAFDRILGRDSTEEMLDALFGRFCIGK